MGLSCYVSENSYLTSDGRFNALSGLYLISTDYTVFEKGVDAVCQCPLGLIPHFYADYSYYGGSTLTVVSMPSRAYTSFLPYMDPETGEDVYDGVNALSGLYLISTILKVSQFQEILSVSMPSRAYTSFLRYPFKNLGFMRFPEPVFAGIYQNILTTVFFRAC